MIVGKTYGTNEKQHEGVEMSYLDSAMSLAASVGYERDRNSHDNAPSIRHALRLMLAMSNEEQMAAALLHDVFKETDFDRDLLLENNIPECVVDAVERMTWRPGMDWDRFVDGIRSDPLANAVMRADVQDHFDMLVSNPLKAADGLGLERLESLWSSLYEPEAA